MYESTEQKHPFLMTVPVIHVWYVSAVFAMVCLYCKKYRKSKFVVVNKCEIFKEYNCNKY